MGFGVRLRFGIESRIRIGWTAKLGVTGLEFRAQALRSET